MFWRGDADSFSFPTRLYSLQEDVPQLQGEGHRAQPKNQVHTPDGHCPRGWPSLQIRRQQMVRMQKQMYRMVHDGARVSFAIVN